MDAGEASPGRGETSSSERGDPVREYLAEAVVVT